MFNEQEFIVKFSLEDLENIRKTKMTAPDLNCHSQPCETYVKGFTEAAAKLCGWDRRDDYVHAAIGHSELLPAFLSNTLIL